MFWQSLPNPTENRSGKAIQEVRQRFFATQEGRAHSDALRSKQGNFKATRYRLSLFEKRRTWLHVLELLNVAPVKRLLVIEQQFDRHAERFTVIDGSGPTLTSFAAAAGGIADGSETDYLEFFTACLLAADGNFVIPRHHIKPSKLVGFRKELHDQRMNYLGSGAAEDRERADEAVAKVNAKIDQIWSLREGTSGLALVPIAVDANRPDEGPAPRWEGKGVLFHGNGAFTVRLKLYRETGMVELTDDGPIAELGKDVHTGTARSDAPGRPPFFVEPTSSKKLEDAPLHPEAAQTRLRETGVLQDVLIESSLTLVREAPANTDTLVLERVSIIGDLRLPGSMPLSVVLRECVVLGRLVATDAHVRGNVTIDNTKIWGLHELPHEGAPGWVRRVADLEGARIDGALVATRLTVRGCIWAPKLSVGSHTDLRGLHVMPPYAIDCDDQGRRSVRFHVADAANMVNFEQANFGASVDLGIYVRVPQSSFESPGFRDAVVVGQLILNHARVNGSLWIAGLSVVKVATDRLSKGSVDVRTALSAWGVQIGGSLLCHLSDSDQSGSGVNIPQLRFVVGGNLELTGAEVGGTVDLRVAHVRGEVSLNASQCEWVSFGGVLCDSSKPLALVRFPLREFIDEPSIQLLLDFPDNVAQNWPIATVRGDLMLTGARVRHGINCVGTQIHGAVTIIGGEIGGFHVKPYVLDCRNLGDKPKCIRARIGSFLAKDLRFTRRIHLFGAVFGAPAAESLPANTAKLSPKTAPVGSTHPRPSLEINNCFVNGGVYFSDPRIYDDPRSFEEKKWAYHWAGFATVEDLSKTSMTDRLAQAELIRKRRSKGEPVPWSEILDDDLLASLFKADVEIVNCELDGDFDFTNAFIGGSLKLTDTLVHADIRAAPFSDEPPRGTWTRAAHCQGFTLDTTTCEGHVDLSGCCVQGRLSARGASIRGELRMVTVPEKNGARLFTAKNLTSASTATPAENDGDRLFTADDSVDLTDVRCGRIVLPRGDDIPRMSPEWSIEGLHVGAYALGVAENMSANKRDEHVAALAFLEQAEFSPQAYVSYERSLVDAGRIEDADRIYRSLKARNWSEHQVGWLFPRRAWATLSYNAIFGGLSKEIFGGLYNVIFGGLYNVIFGGLYKAIFGGLMGFGTRFLRPLGYFIASLAIVIWAVSSPIDLQPSNARLAAAEAGERSTHLRNECPDDWGFLDSLWLALHYAVPIVSVVDSGDWEPRESPPDAGSLCAALATGEETILERLKRCFSPKNIVFVIATLNWILLPVFLLGVTARIQRRRN